MEWNVNQGINNGEQEEANAFNQNIRIFHIQKIGADSPQQTCNATWSTCSPETMRETSAIGYFFARELQQNLNVPVGIIVSAWGGTPIEVWMEKNSIIQNPELDKNKFIWPDASRPDEPGILYNSMIYPLIPFGIAGAIWYQGESNTMNHSVYATMMKTMIAGWRKDFKKDFPFYFVQIAPFDYWQGADAKQLREQQEIASKTIPNSGMVVISDLVDDVKDIHPKNKQDVGKRLANYALAETYKKEISAYKSPMYLNMQIEKSTVRLTFSNVLTVLKSTGKTPGKFLIAGEDRNFVPAIAKIDGKTILLSSKQIKSPVAVRYCFDNTSLPDVFSAEGLPLAPFRTDNWDK
jgi:sialate O-acetylesterase